MKIEYTIDSSLYISEIHKIEKEHPQELEQERNALKDDLDDLANLIPGTGSETGVAIRRVRVVHTEKAADGSIVLRLRMTLVRNRPKASQIVVRVALSAGNTEPDVASNAPKGKEASIRYAAVFEDSIRFAEGFRHIFGF